MPAVDADADGVAESVAFDQNGDGEPDIWWADLTGNGVADTMVFDADGDGKPDTFADPSENGQWTYVATEAPQQPAEQTPVDQTQQPVAQTGQTVDPTGQPVEQTGQTAQPAPSGDVAGTFWQEHFPGEPFPTDRDPGMQLAKIIARIEQVPNWKSDPS